MTTTTSRFAIKTATADKWKIEWAILKGFASYSREAVLAADYHDSICNDA
jgi:hypothetical protein